MVRGQDKVVLGLRDLLQGLCSTEGERGDLRISVFSQTPVRVGTQWGQCGCSPDFHQPPSKVRNTGSQTRGLIETWILVPIAYDLEERGDPRTFTSSKAQSDGVTAVPGCHFENCWTGLL